MTGSPAVSCYSAVSTRLGSVDRCDRVTVSRCRRASTECRLTARVTVPAGQQWPARPHARGGCSSSARTARANGRAHNGIRRTMRIATWNVNSLNARLPRVEEWLSYAQPDILCMQETKVADGAFPAMPFSAAGYEVAHHGDGRWNGGARASRVGIKDLRVGCSSGADEQGSRIMSANCGGVTVYSVYVPNGRSVDSEFY